MRESASRRGRRVRTRALPVDGAGVGRGRDEWLAVEEPLEIRVTASGETRPVATTMRTPGDDFDLAVGYLVSEGIVADRSQVRGIRYCVDRVAGQQQHFNAVTVDLDGAMPDLEPLHRHGTITSACGVCGKTRIEVLDELDLPHLAEDATTIDASVLTHLPATLRDAQPVFDATGGLHAAALFTADGSLIEVREDVGRHNALDKLIGASLMAGRLPLRGGIVLVSGRASFELAQKTVAAGAPVLAAISAPSSLAVDVARRFGLTLAGFLREGRCNVYTGHARITGDATSLSA